MKKLKINQLLLLFIIHLLFVFSCNGQTTEPYEVSVNGKLVYVEGLQGEGWLLANPFGELVLLDGDEQKRHVLTWDEYFYAHPNLTPDGESLIFESKRSRNIRLIGLSAESDIYRMDLQTLEISSISREMEQVLGQPLGERFRNPSVSPSGEKVSFVRYQNGNSYLSVFDFKENELIDLTDDEGLMPNSITTIEWSPDEQHFIYTMTDGFSRYPVLISLKDGKVTNVHQSPEIKESEQGLIVCTSGSWKNNSEFIFHCYDTFEIRNNIFTYNLQDNEPKLIAHIDRSKFDYSVRSLKLNPSGNQALFIGSDFRGESSDIWLFDLEEKTLSRVTTNGTRKRGLRWYN